MNDTGDQKECSISTSYLKNSNMLKTFETLAIEIFGEQEFDNVLFFFCGILNDCLSFLRSSQDFLLAFLTRRCHVAFQIFLEYIEAVLYLYSESHDSAISSYTRPILMMLFKANTEFSINIEYAEIALLLKDLQQVKAASITDTNLLSLSPVLAAYYRKKGEFPHIILGDELLIHGRAFNGILQDLENRIHLEFAEGDAEHVLNKFWENTSLRVYTVNKNTLLLLARYRDRLQYDKLRTNTSWRELSARFARLIETASINNISYSWGIRIPDSDVGKPLNLPIAPNMSKFPCCGTFLQHIYQDTFLFLYPNASQVQAIGTVRLKKSLLPLLMRRGENEMSFSECAKLMVPYWMFDQLPFKNVYSLYQKLNDDFARKGKHRVVKLLRREESSLQSYEDHDQIYYQFFQERNELVLQRMLVFKWQQEVLGVPTQKLFYTDYIDFEQLARNYNWFSVEHQGERITLLPHDAIDALRELWEWEPEEGLLEQYLDVLLDGVPFIWESGSMDYIVEGYSAPNEVLQTEDPVSVVVLDTISQIGLEAEQHAYERYNSTAFEEATLADWGVHYSLRDVLLACEKTIREFSRFYNKTISQVPFCQVIAVLTQAMDLGLIGMAPCYGICSQKSDAADRMFTMIKAGEQSLYIKPIQLRKFIPVLLDIKREWPDPQDAQLAIERFVYAYEAKYPKESLNIKQLLPEFLRQLERSGQTLEEWGIPLFNFHGLNYSTQENDENSGTMLRSQDWIAREECLQVYHNML